jgi:hypothetical protein
MTTQPVILSADPLSHEVPQAQQPQDVVRIDRRVLWRLYIPV